MSDQPSPSGGNPIQTDFQDFMQRGDDFFRIELLRPARNWYKKALELNIETDQVKQRIAACDRMLAFENKVIGLLGIVLVIVLVTLLFL